MYRRVLSQRTLFAPISLLIVLALMSAFLTINHYNSARQSRQWVIHSHQVVEAAQSMFSDVQDVESGTRGLLLAKSPVYLDNFQTGVQQFPVAAAELVRLVADSPEQSHRAQELVGLLRTRVDLAQDRVNMALAGNFAEASVVSGAGKKTMDEARTRLTQLVLSERLLLAERTAQADRDEQIGIVIALGVSLLATLGLGFLILALYRSNQDLGQEMAAREEAEAARREAALLYRVIFDNVADNLFVTEVSPDGVYSLLDVNPAYETSVGVPIERMRGRDIRKIIANGEDLVRDYDKIVASGKAAIIRRELPFKAGLRTWESTLVPAADETGRITRLIGVARDITEREKAEERSRSTQKMEAIGHLTGGVAHDFNNLLQVIRGNLELLAPVLKDKVQASQRLKNAIHGADRAAQLTRQLLAFARRQPLEPKVVNLGRLVGDMADMLNRALGESVGVETVIAGGLWNTLADPAQVESAILNLAINARDAMPDGGKLTIELTNAGLDETYASREGVEIEPGQYVLLAISDTGHGMPAATLARVFEPFFTTKAVDKGTGLGLSMVFGFVKQSGGHIQIYSEEGEGTTVKIYLPRSRRPEELATPLPAAPLTGRSEVILVVEDEDMVRAAAVGMLRDMDYTCLHAANGAEALQILKSGAKIDLLFTDVIMPGEVKSRDLAAQAQALYPNLPVLFTSGYTENAIVHHGRLDEGVHLLSKPYQREDLARRVRSLLDAAKPVVLIVEDEPLVRMAAIDMIEEAGFTVLQAADAKQALEHLNGKSRIDILFTDIGLPGMRGPELAVEAVKLRKGVKVVFASGYGEAAGDMADAQYLSKPYDQDDLVRTLRG
jgi:PAS domain S-box-containing protein